MLWNYIKSFKVDKEANKPKELYPWIYKQHQQGQVKETVERLSQNSIEDAVKAEKPIRERDASSAEEPQPKKLKRDEEPAAIEDLKGESIMEQEIKSESSEQVEDSEDPNKQEIACSQLETKTRKITDFFKRLE